MTDLLASLETHLTGDTPAVFMAAADDLRRVVAYARGLEERVAELELVVEAYRAGVGR